MLRSRPLLCAAVFSCVLHISLLGVAAGLLVTHGRATTAPLKVTRLQPAVPLPVGDFKGPEAGGQHEEKPPDPTPPPPPRPQPKPQTPAPKATVPPGPKTKRPRPPKEVVAPAPALAPPLSATFTLPPSQEGLADNVGTDNNVVGKQSLNDDTSRSMGATTNAHAPRKGGGGGLSARPDYGANPKPPYPMLARRRGEQGLVLLRVHVRVDGSVAEAEIKQSSGSTLLDDAALHTVRESCVLFPPSSTASQSRAGSKCLFGLF